MNKRFDKISIYATVLGGLPLLMLIFLPAYLWHHAQFVAQTYLVVILAFISGIDWKVALERKHSLVLCWSILLSLLPWFILTYSLLTADVILSWTMLWVVLNTAWFIDLRFIHNDKLLVTVRNVGSVTLNVLLLAIILRLLLF